MSINWRPISWWALFAPLMRFLLGRRRVVTNQAEFQHALDTVKNWDTIEVAKGTVLEDGVALRGP